MLLALVHFTAVNAFKVILDLLSSILDSSRNSNSSITEELMSPFHLPVHIESKASMGWCSVHPDIVRNCSVARVITAHADKIPEGV